MSQGRDLHTQAADARENGDFIKALELTDQALKAYQQDQDLLGFAEIHSERNLSLNHLYSQTGFKPYLISAKFNAKAAVKIAEESGDKTALAIPYFNLAKVQQDLGHLEEALESYQKAIENMEQNPPELHNRPAVLLDMKLHQVACQYLAGQKEVIEQAQDLISQLEQTEEPKYNKDVWLSGAHMRLAAVLREDNPNEARKHLEKAKEIIEANPDLKLRKSQLEKLTKEFS